MRRQRDTRRLLETERETRRLLGDRETMRLLGDRGGRQRGERQRLTDF